MAYWRETEDADQRATRRPGMWAHLTWTILTLVGVVGLGLLGVSLTGGGTQMSDARTALAALLVYVTLCMMIIRVDRTIKGHERVKRAASEERRRRFRRRPYSVVDEAEAVLAPAQGQGPR